MRFFYNPILMSRDDGLLLIQANHNLQLQKQLHKASKSDLAACEKHKKRNNQIKITKQENGWV